MPTKRRDLDNVVQWRQTQLIDAGFPPPLAVRVARDQSFDLQALIELVEHGCSPTLATSILEPIDRDDSV